MLIRFIKWVASSELFFVYLKDSCASLWFVARLYRSRHENICFFHMRKQMRRSVAQVAADKRRCFNNICTQCNFSIS